jgi:hypothetical protein
VEIPGHSQRSSSGECERTVTLCVHSPTCFFQVTAVESIDLEERTATNQIPSCNTPEVVDLVSKEKYTPDKYRDCGESPLEAAGGTSRIPEGQYKQHPGHPSACDIKNSSPADSNDESNKHMLATMEKLCGQVEMLRKSIILMEERLTLIEDKTRDFVSSKHQ